MQHELWFEANGEQTFCLSGPHGDKVRALLEPGSKLVWQVEAESHFEAMMKYYEYMNWGEYKTEFPEQDKTLYRNLGWE